MSKREKGTQARATRLGLLALALAGALALLTACGTTAHDAAPGYASPAPTTTTATTPSASATATATTMPTRAGQFDHRGGIDTVAGKAYLGATTDGTLVLRLEGLQASDGPDLYVFLARVATPSQNSQVTGGYEVARLKATSGDQNYTLPAGFDATPYASVVIYCKTYSVIYGFANLSA